MSAHLQIAKAEEDIEQANERIRRQKALIAELERDGHDTTAAVKLLDAFEETLKVMKAHRDFLAAQIRFT